MASFSSGDPERGREPTTKLSTVWMRNGLPAAFAPSARAMVAAPCAVPISTKAPPPRAAALS
jgi:hypothetical protein